MRCREEMDFKPECLKSQDRIGDNSRFKLTVSTGYLSRKDDRRSTLAYRRTGPVQQGLRDLRSWLRLLSATDNLERINDSGVRENWTYSTRSVRF